MSSQQSHCVKFNVIGLEPVVPPQERRQSIEKYIETHKGRQRDERLGSKEGHGKDHIK
jgi:hypothetical protein